MRTTTTGCHGAVLALACLLIASCSPGDQSGVDVPSASSGQIASTSSPDADGAASRPVIAERLPYAEIDDELVYGHFAIPADMIDPLPAVILIHDWWGLNDQMKQAAEKLASEGYIVLGVDLFGGEIAAVPAVARNLELDVVENPELAVQNLKAAYDFIRNTAGAPRIATVGFGFGGGWSLTAAIEMPAELSASVVIYGQVVDDEELLAPVNVSLLGLFAQADRAVPVETVKEFESVLASLDKDFEIQIYRNARRGFADQLSENYSARVAEDAWSRLLAFLELRMAQPSE